MNSFKQTACQHFFSCFLTLFAVEALEMAEMPMEMDTKTAKTGFFSAASGHPLPTSHQNGSPSPTSGHNAWNGASFKTATFNRRKKFAFTVPEAVFDAIESDWQSLFARH
jgi:hypothetical protein